MTKTILITGSTDGLGFETAKLLAAQGHTVLLHGRSEAKLVDAEREIRATTGTGTIETFRADLSRLDDVDALAESVAARPRPLDVLINNAGVFRVPQTKADNGLDVRFMVNTVAPYRLARRLLPSMASDGRIINLSSAAQAPVDAAALQGRTELDHSTAYAQSKLALTMWSNHLAAEQGAAGPVIVAVNPGSFLGTKMVKEAYGTAGKDIAIGAELLAQAAVSPEFQNASGRYYDNDSGQFAQPHPDALDTQKNARLADLLDALLVDVAS